MRFRPAAPVLALLMSALSAGASIASGGQPIQVALFNPVQIVNEKQSISGLRISLLYGLNQDVQGLDWGFVSHTRGNEFAWQVGGVGIVEKDFTGWQDNWVNMSQGEFTGLASGVFNQGNDVNGVQFGFVNVAQHMHGLQLGLLNMTQTMHGLQIGVANMIQKGKTPFLPIVNWSR